MLQLLLNDGVYIYGLNGLRKVVVLRVTEVYTATNLQYSVSNSVSTEMGDRYLIYRLNM